MFKTAARKRAEEVVAKKRAEKIAKEAAKAKEAAASRKSKKAAAAKEEASANDQEETLLPIVAEGVLTPAELEDLIEKFSEKATEHKTGEKLNKQGFKELVTELIAESEEAEAVPEKDLEVAFVITFEDEAGTISRDDFISLYHLIHEGFAQGLGGVSSSFPKAPAEKKAMQTQFKEDLASEDVLTMVLSEDELKKLRKKFRYKIKAQTSGNKGLEKWAFRELMKDVLAGSGEDEVLTNKDLDKAFAIADEGNTGTIDKYDFINMYRLAKKGEVKGLSGGGGMFSTSSKELLERHTRFAKSLATEDVLSHKEVENLKVAFKKKAELHGSDDLDKQTFKVRRCRTRVTDAFVWV
jgi:hypothetical protein